MRKIVLFLSAIIITFGSQAQTNNNGLIFSYDFNGSGIDSVSKKSINLDGIRFGEDFCDTENKSIAIKSSSPKIEIPIDNKHFSTKTGLTFSTWVYYQKDKSADHYFIAGQWGRKQAQRRFSLELDKNHHINFKVFDGKVGEYGITSDKKLYDEVWYHIVGVYYPDERQQIYINGELHGQGIQKGSGINASVEGPMVLGKQKINDTTYNFYKGRLDKIKLYNRALSMFEITKMYNHEKRVSVLWNIQ